MKVYTLEDKSLTKIMEVFILEVKRFQTLCHVQFDLDIFVKFTIQIGIALEKQ